MVVRRRYHDNVYRPSKRISYLTIYAFNILIEDGEEKTSHEFYLNEFAIMTD